MAGRRLIIARESCPGTLVELTDYRWDAKTTAMGVERPLKQRDHGADALRWAVSTLWPRIGVLSVSREDSDIAGKLRLIYKSRCYSLRVEPTLIGFNSPSFSSIK